MKRFKQTDLGISLLLLSGFSVWFLFDQCILFTAYFITGGWQVFSMLVHFITGYNLKKGSDRSAYHWCSLAVIATAVLSLWVHLLIFIWLVLLVAAPVMAAIYTYICYKEVRNGGQRPSDLF